MKEKIECLLPDDGKTCVRLRGKNGNFVTILPCGTDVNGNVTNVDLCKPNGEVLYCGVDIELVNIFCEELGLERILQEK